VTTTISFPAFGTTAVLVVTDPDAQTTAASLLRERLRRVDRACSRFRDDSELAAANRRSGEPIELSAELYGFVRAALDAAHSTDGLVDPALGNELRAAGYDRTFVLVAARDGWTFREVERRCAAWREIELDDDRRLLRVPRGVELDLGATGKARTADLAAREIAGATGSGALVALGGDVAAAGPPPAGGWPVLVAERHDAVLDGPGERIALLEGGLATSSTTARSWTTDRGRMHHVIDPRTGLPAAEVWRTATVAAASCLDANVASTAALVLGAGARSWLEQRRVHARLVAHTGAVVATRDWPVALECAA
jgi:thiamine biosynthesis lipoprotein